MRPRSKRLGQNFLHDSRILKREVEYAGVEGKKVLEIGAGTGNLTVLLAEKAKEVIAIEKDGRLAGFLAERMATTQNVHVITADFLEWIAPAIDVVVSNVPYSVASPILFKLAELDFERAVLCLQEEFAKRMVAKPDTREYSRLSVMAQLCFEIELLDRVPKGAFSPIPKVDSRIVRLARREEKGVDEKTALFIRAIFQHRKKKLENAIIDSRKEFGIEKAELKKRIDSLRLRERRVFTLTKEEIAWSAGEFRKTVLQ
ncbi:MAG: 16S rRNA (adenine(1518)-N(6)/adenine(1519)-N(6))-dimethyltransferase RsmA [Candidatus Micrarchaeota archaeon]|nr:16S rRNA (adenine(1518)-N(6)/adenine(1519)-N(6))-dimethyltransferase RsmA [Candidatus Micrarchaeota archaeon]